MLHEFHRLFVFPLTVYLSNCDLFGTFTLQFKSVCGDKHYIIVCFSVEKYLSLAQL